MPEPKEINIFDFTDYRQYLAARLRESEGRGSQSRLAKHLKVHTTLVSQVLCGLTNFSVEHGEEINLYLHHNDEESEYFRLLLAKERAGTKLLKDVVGKKIQTLLQARSELRGRVSTSKALPEAEKAIYYSSYFYPLLHVACLLPGLSSVEALADRLGCSQKKVRDGLDFLLRAGLLEKHGAGFRSGSSVLHLDKESPWLTTHHVNFRNFTMARLEDRRPSDLHYSSALTISKKDAARIRDGILKNFQENAKIVQGSSDEEVYVYCFDFFPLR
jgi:uncharacterized protein (TIGR02147 family)